MVCRPHQYLLFQIAQYDPATNSSSGMYAVEKLYEQGRYNPVADFWQKQRYVPQAMHTYEKRSIWDRTKAPSEVLERKKEEEVKQEHVERESSPSDSEIYSANMAFAYVPVKQQRPENEVFRKVQKDHLASLIKKELGVERTLEELEYV